MDLWPHQRGGIDDTLSAIARGERRILLTSPTGGGKTRIMAELIRHYLEAAHRVVLYTNRKMLVDQTSEKLLDDGLYHGIRAAGYEDRRDQLLQVSSIQTENSRVLKRQCWPLHAAQLVLVDEAHMQAHPHRFARYRRP
jgi:DNA repair protein RadD